MKELSKPVQSKALAEDLVKGFNAFLAQGGEAQDLIARYGDEVTRVVAKARSLAPEMESAFNVNFLRDAFDTFNGLDAAMKETGNDIRDVFTQLSSGDTTKLRSEIDSLRGSLESATDYINDLQARIRDLNNLDAGQLQSELKTIRTRMGNEFHEWANVNGLETHYDWGTFQSQIEGIEAGSLTARDAIAQVKYEYSDLLREASTSGAALGSSASEIEVRMAALDAAIVDIQARMANGGIAGIEGAAATGGIQEDVIRRVAEAMIEFSAGANEAGQSATSAVDKITALVQSLTNFGGIDSGNLETIRNMFGLISQFNRLSVSNASMENLRSGIESLMAVANSAGADKINALRDLSRVDFRSFNELHVSKASLSNLAAFLPTIGTANIEPLRQIAGIRWDNLKELKVSKASVENLANLAQIADTVEQLRARIDAAGLPSATQGISDTAAVGAAESTVNAEATAHEHAAAAARDHAAAEREAAAAENEHASAAQMDAQAAMEAAQAEQALSDAAAGQADITAQIEQEAAAHEHSAEAARQQAEAEREVTQATGQAAADSAVIEEAASAHEAAAGAAHQHAEAERTVSQATEEAATSGDRIEQAASAHSQAAQAAEVQASAEQNVAQSLAEVRRELDAVSGGAGGSNGGMLGSDDGDVKARITQLQQLIALQKQIGTFIVKNDGGVGNIEGAAELYNTVTQSINSARAELDAYMNSIVESGTATSEVIGMIKTVFAEISSSASIGDMIAKKEGALKAQEGATWREYYAEIEAAEQKALAASEKYYDARMQSAERAAAATEQQTQREIEAWKRADDARIAREEDQAFKRTAQENATWREYYSEREAMAQKAQAASERYYDAQAKAAERAASATEQQTQREIDAWKRVDDARLAKEEDQAFRRAAQENASWREYYAEMEAAAQKAQAASDSYYQRQADEAARAASAAEQAAQREADAWNRVEDAKAAAELKIVQSNAQRAVSSLNGSEFDTSAVENLRQKVNELRDDITRALADTGSLSTEAMAGFQGRAAEIEQMAASIRKEGEAAREAAAAEIQLRTAQDMRNKVQSFIDKNPRAYEAYKSQLDGYMAELQRAGGVTSERAAQIASDLKNIKAASDSAGISGQTFFQKLQQGWQRFAGWSLVTRSFMLVIRGFKQMVNSVKEIDLAMTELRKVTDLTAVGYENFYQKAVDATTKIGATISDTINAAADFARLGYDASDALSLAESAITYKHVGDFVIWSSQAAMFG